MMRFMRDLRLIPIALIASACLLALKTADLVLDGSRWFAADNVADDGDTSVIRTSPDAPQPPGMRQSWARQMFNFPDGAGSSATPDIAPAPAERGNLDITGSVSETDAKTEPAGTGGKDTKDGKDGPNGKDGPSGKESKITPPPKGTAIPTDGPAAPTGAERAILERLQQRRQELEARARELDIRESLIKAAEKHIEARLAELKDVESRITAETEQKDEAQAARFKGLVTMYENMKPRDAAKIFNRLDMAVLMQVASKINPRQMSEILAQMSPDMAERLTVELANKAQHTEKNDPAALPKIDGRPTTP